MSSKMQIFCSGPLLHTVQMSRIFEDSKTFVDMKMKHSPVKISENFASFMEKSDGNPSKQQVNQFVIENFEQCGSEFQEYDPEDWKDDPEFLRKITDVTYRNFASTLHTIWRKLARKISNEVRDELERFSLIWVPNPVIVPGGRFREFYYWDSYWIIKGLLISEMYDTVKGMIDNYLYLVEKFGYIPNGGRVYYMGRSQPPFLIPAFKLFMESNYGGDLKTYLEKSIKILELEFEFWMNHRMKIVKYNGKTYKLATYNDKSDGPRPESYVEDVNMATMDDKNKFYTEIKAACESGMDFSSRWFVGSKKSIQNIKTTSIIPVDLNAFLYGNAVILCEFYEVLGNSEKASFYKNLADELNEAVNAVLWNEEKGIWLDYDVENEVKRDYFYASNLTPLWTGCYNKSNEKEIVKKNLNYLQHENILNFPGGIPNSLENTGEQWDFPNAWAPLQHMIIFGLKRTNCPEAHEVAKTLATKWLKSNYEAFMKTEHMAEKYDATVLGECGGGGEYSVQFGFGWTNAVLLDILVSFFSSN